MKKKKCYCCGNFTLDIGSIFEICEVCHWQDDIVQNDDINYRGGANETSLKEAKETYKKIGASNILFKDSARAPKKSEIG